ncbi:Deoxyribonuclease tatD, putative [Perkinsus marinus ATCC 50983]|uniref:Deoxyribonuclease tatD, putative n=1 Tax=Perkinsus marinus (strain ATCC 50983 / TXsc) TaxID=423536 RepID=C5K8H6_PERM5|nr:Deoxyribonuclease tatD, putative [Perkinsus marinus ATCC 50983]EER19183.1 Deoxyribonuclease tatD, putative [Perkinsus marinus ATCC 50983]|eukprot:XP_002787387.1 Deoxyribonuclease tatD, putative [Perkinsus marinus ATCC 50983]
MVSPLRTGRPHKVSEKLVLDELRKWGCMGSSGEGLVDIGANIATLSDGLLAQQLRRSLAAGVKRIIVTGTSVKRSKWAEQLCRERIKNVPSGDRPKLFFTAGVHPHEVKNCDETTIAELRRLAASPYCVAIGECGLDYDRMFSTREEQLKWFDRQVALASELHMPLFLHERDRVKGGGPLGSDKDCLRILSKHSIDPKQAVFHCFTGTRQIAQEYIQKGYWIGLTGYVCMRARGASIRSMVSCGYLPLSRLMLETDSPYMRGDDDYYEVEGLKGTKKTEPAGTVAVAYAVAELLGVTPEEVTKQTTENVLKLFPKISQVDADEEEHPSDDDGFW